MYGLWIVNLCIVGKSVDSDINEGVKLWVVNCK